MRAFLTIIAFTCFAKTSFTQKVRLEGDTSKYLCLNDSIAETFTVNLKKEKVDSTITILYDFDNGRLQTSKRIVIWTHDGKSNLRIVQGCDKILSDTTYLFNAENLWAYIRVTHFDDFTVPIKSGTGQSHDRFYHLTVSTPKRSFFVVVRDNERRSTPRNPTPEIDTRVMLTNKIDSLIK